MYRSLISIGILRSVFTKLLESCLPNVVKPVGKTVFLDVHPDVLFRRLRIAKQQRPILQGKEDDELKAFIIRALEQRAPFYTQAQYIFNADELEDRWQIETAVQRLQELLGL